MSAIVKQKFRHCLVEDIVAPVRNAIVGGPFGSDLVSRDYVADGVPVIRGQNMGPGRWVGGDFAFVSHEKADSLSANCAKFGDLVVTQRGTLGQVALVPRDTYSRYLISQSQMKLTPDSQQVDVEYLYYFFVSPAQQEYVHSSAIRTGVPHTNLGHLKKTPLLLPELGEQRTIAKLLGTIDDKIDMNQRTSETLEAMARALFKSWFVDFDPVRAKSEGGMPAGWPVRPLGEVMELKRGYDLPARDREPGEVPIVSSSGITGWHSKHQVKSPGVVTGRYGTIGKVFYIGQDFWPLNTALYVVDFKGNEPWFVFHLLETVEFGQFVDKGAVPGINRNHLHMCPVVAPTQEAQRKFAAAVAPLHQQCQLNEAQSATLAELRDTLLPKLISGEVRIKDAEKLASAAL